MADDISKVLQKQLSSRLGWVTRTVNLCSELQSKTPIPKELLRKKITDLENRWHNYEESFKKLETYLLEKKFLEDLEEVTRSHDSNFAAYMDKISSFEVSVMIEPTTTGIANGGVIQGLKLPAITLPQFTGEGNWFEFWDKFKGLVHDRTDIAPVTKFSYLMGQLTGIALDVIRELPITDYNYDIAIQLLKQNFENAEANLQRLVNKLIDLEGPKHNHQELTTFRITIGCLLKSLSIHKNLTEAGWLLDLIIQKKLAQRTCDELYHRYKKNFFTCKEIEDGLLEVCKHLDSTKKEVKDPKESKEVKGKNNSKGKQNGNKTHFKEKKEEVGTFLANVQTPSNSQGVVNSRKPSGGTQAVASTTTTNKPADSGRAAGTQKKKCMLCDEEHATVFCHKYTSLSSRIQRLEEIDRCLACLGSNHKSDDCKTNLSQCFRCKKGAHHAALCPTTKEIKSSNSL